jgi:nitroimidazol reductase NimA-like FMN-containing flavoprotein (pyridoxamine 5'-phosphate oxidase superfamily)
MAKYHMNKQEREITDEQILRGILKQGKYTTIAMCRTDEPYIVTLNYGYDEEKHALYFHTALKGLKLDFIRDNPEVCGTVIEDKGYIMDKCAHGYCTVVFWGTMTVVEALEEKKYGMDILLHHLEDRPDTLKKRILKDDTVYQNVGILRLDIHESSGKEGQ